MQKYKIIVNCQQIIALRHYLGIVARSDIAANNLLYDRLNAAFFVSLQRINSATTMITRLDNKILQVFAMADLCMWTRPILSTRWQRKGNITF